ncbi:DUF3080 domain-containing protein [Vibrio sp.]|uniref:DUF3080 domain-containing protein n=1 Tax=Vibrio sp. TaxID=678 RepID=UPI003D0B3DD6
MLSLLLLWGCDSQKAPIPAAFELYLSRLANVLETEPLPLPSQVNIVLPDTHSLRVEIADMRLGLLDSYELRQCGLFHLIAERNSPLGKVQDQFRNLDYQVKLLHGLEYCLQSSNISQELNEKLRPLYAIKQKQLIDQLRNLLYTSEAMRAQLSGYQWLPVQSGFNQRDVMTALDHLAVLSSGSIDQTTDSYSVAAYQEVLEKQPLIGQLHFSMLNAVLLLDQATKQLESGDAKLFCGPGRDNTQVQYLNNVFQHYFIEPIQSYLATLDAVYLQVAPYIADWPQGNGGYVYPIFRTHGRFRTAIRHHVEYWQSLFKRCGVKVGAN